MTMDLRNISDPSGVSALLEQLKASAAWQELIAATPTPSLAVPPSSADVEIPAPAELEVAPASNIPTMTSSVASLLSQLHSIPPEPAVGWVQDEFTNLSSLPEPPPALQVRPEHKSDIRGYTFQQALPLLSQLADDPSFATTITKIKRDQDDLERQLWSERQAIYKKHQEKIKVAQTRAQMVGVTVSQHEIDMIVDAFKRELRLFDRDRIIPSWDGLIARQQQELAIANVPTMFSTTEPEDRKRQQQVIEVLENLIDLTRV